METAFEGWKPNDANLDSRIGGVLSQIAAQLNEAAADGATNIYRFFGAKVVGINPTEAEQASGLATWVVTDTLGHTIPGGTIAVFQDGLGNHWGFEAVDEIVIPAGKSEATGVAMRSVLPGEGANGISGVAVELASPIPFIASVTMTSQTNGGAEEEEDSAYLNKLTEEFQTLSPKPILPKDFNKLLLQKAGVGRTYTLGGFNPAATTTHTATVNAGSKVLKALGLATTKLLVPGTEVSGTGIPAGTRIAEIQNLEPGEVFLTAEATVTGTPTITFTGLAEQPGCVTSWITNKAGEALTEPNFEKELQENCLTGVLFKLMTPTYVTVNVEVQVAAWPGQNLATVKAAVETAVKEYLSPLSWGLPPTGQTNEWNNDVKVRLINVEAAVLRVVGTHFITVVRLASLAADFTMTGGVVVLPKLGTLSVTVTEG